MKDIGTEEDYTCDLVRDKQSPLVSLPPAATENRNNNFNLLRILLATLVLLSHSPELADGDRHREILTRLFGTISFGELAVDGFFLLSGFLIVQSWQRTPNFLNFFKKRVLRIYPAFIVASLVSAFVVGPLGADVTQYLAQFKFVQFLGGMVLLHLPIVPPVFKGQPDPWVNGSMWTISYEFRCYIIAALFGACGVVGRRQLWLILSGTILLLALAPSIGSHISFRGFQFLFGDPIKLTHLLAFFCAGGCFYLFRDRILYKTSWVIMAAIILIICMFKTWTADLALCTVGAYILFLFAFAQFSFLERYRTCPDISYGVYLYGWPIQKLLLWYIPSLSPWLLFLLTCGLSCICGLLSWHLVERPFLRLKRNKA